LTLAATAVSAALMKVATVPEAAKRTVPTDTPLTWRSQSVWAVGAVPSSDRRMLASAIPALIVQATSLLKSTRATPVTDESTSFSKAKPHRPPEVVALKFAPELAEESPTTLWATTK
jgi:hypothetical protein